MNQSSKDARQAEIASSITESLLASRVHLTEAPTGFGKTRVVLRSAFQTIKSSGRGVIVTTKNNALAKQMVAESYKMGGGIIDPMKIVLDLGRRNYIDYPLALQSTSTGVLQGKITQDELDAFVNDQLSKFPHLKRENLLLSDLYDLILSNGYIVSMDELVYEVSQSSTGAIEQKEFDELFRYLKDGMVVVTNHHYLLMLAHLGKFDTFGYPIIADEVHSMADAAEGVFQSSFSFWRLKHLSAEAVAYDKKYGLYDKKTSEKLDELFSSANRAQKSITTISLGGNGSHEDVVRDIAKSLKSDAGKSVSISVLNGMKNSPKHIFETKKNLSLLGRELTELMNVAEKPFGINLSPSKSYATINYASSRPMFDLHRYFWSKVDKGFAGLSGTLRIAQSKAKDDNRWVYFYLGLFKKDIDKEIPLYLANRKGATQEGAEYLRQRLARINNMVEESIFDVIDPVFDRNRFWSWVAPKELTPPKITSYGIDEEDDGKFRRTRRSHESISADYDTWYGEIASFVHANLVANALVLTLSNEDAAVIAALLRNKSKGRYEVLCPSESEPLWVIVEQHKRIVAGGRLGVIVGNAAFYTGIDLPGDEVQQVFMARLPFEPQRYSHAKQNRSEESWTFSSANDITNKMILNFRQGIGRAVRSENDHAVCYVLDGRINNKMYAKAYGFLQETSVLVDLSRIQNGIKSFLLAKADDKDPVYAKWLIGLVCGMDVIGKIDAESLIRIDDRAYELRSKQFHLGAGVETLKAKYVGKEIIAEEIVLSAYLYQHYVETSEVMAPKIIEQYGSLEAYYPIFFSKKFV